MSIAICRTTRLPETDAEDRVRVQPKSTAICQTLEALCAVTVNLPIGTNLGLLHFLWMQVSGMLLPHRGALFPALQAIGLLPRATRRAWAAFRYGAWEIADLLWAFEGYVQEQGHWQATSYAGYKPIPVDLTAYWRPTLRGWLTKHYHAVAGKALPAVVVGIIARVGRVQDQRGAIPTQLVRTDPENPSEASLQRKVIRQAAKTLAQDEIPVLDAGFKIGQLQGADLSRYVVRLAKNFTARQNELPPAKGRGRKAEYGGVIRPLSRTRKNRRLPATPPDRTETWIENNMIFRAEFWDHLVLPEAKVHKEVFEVVEFTPLQAAGQTGEGPPRFQSVRPFVGRKRNQVENTHFQKTDHIVWNLVLQWAILFVRFREIDDAEGQLRHAGDEGLNPRRNTAADVRIGAL